MSHKWKEQPPAGQGGPDPGEKQCLLQIPVGGARWGGLQAAVLREDSLEEVLTLLCLPFFLF
jgi:hypothetical protein